MVVIGVGLVGLVMGVFFLGVLICLDLVGVGLEVGVGLVVWMGGGIGFLGFGWGFIVVW